MDRATKVDVSPVVKVTLFYLTLKEVRKRVRRRGQSGPKRCKVVRDVGGSCDRKGSESCRGGALQKQI